MFSFLKKFFPSTDYKSLIRKGAIIVDVRTGQEFDQGHIATAKNIPLDRIKNRIVELKAYGVPVICCCASGNRSALAANLLRSNGIKAYNGGAWIYLAKKIRH
jgi:rhodanese-related sulfurtransferase